MHVFNYALLTMLLFFSYDVIAQSRHDQALLVTDINQKIAMGFIESDVVYELPNNKSLDLNADSNTIRGAGTVVRIGYMGVESEGRTSAFEYGSSGLGDIHRTGSELFTDILLDLPEGADFDFVRIWGNDTNAAQDMSFFLFERCLPEFSSGDITSTTLGSIDSNTSAGIFSVLINIVSDNITVDNTGCTYTLRTRFDAADSTLRLFKVRAEFQTL